jgi:polysaccharide biosynthesis/export protein
MSATDAHKRASHNATPTPMTVLQAIAMAGGFADFAKLPEITIVRSRPGLPDTVFAFDYTSAVNGTSPDQNIRLESEDVVVVP